MAARSRANGNGDKQAQSIDYLPFKITLDAETVELIADAVAARLAARLPQSADDHWLDSRGAAAYLAMPLSTLRKLAAADVLPAYQDTPGGCLYFKRSELDEWRRSGSASK